MSHTWGRPARQPGSGWAVIDVETSGFRPGHARIISLAALALDADGRVEQSVVSLLNPGVDPGPTHVHGLTAAMLEDQPQFADIAGDVVELLRGRTLVAHNIAFDYGFLAAEAEIANRELPVDTVMCTVELAPAPRPGRRQPAAGNPRGALERAATTPARCFRRRRGVVSGARRSTAAGPGT